MKIRVCIPSYRRPEVATFKYLSCPYIYVDRSEYEAYVDANPGHEDHIIAVPDGVQGNIARVRNYIMRANLVDDDYDAICIIDDDMEGMYIWEVQGCKSVKRKISEEEFLILLQKYGMLCDELGFKYWGAQCNQDQLSYREYTPFSFSSFIGAPFQNFLRGNECYHDENIPLKEDYDMTLQQCNKYRGCLRLNFLTYNVKQSEQAGGCATYRNYQREMQQLLALQKKWGSKIVKIDESNKGRTSKKKLFDYNPIIKIPIKGV